MKMAKKSLLVVALLLCIAGGSLAAYAAFTVTSNTVEVVLNYNVTLTESVSGSVITLDALVTNGTTPISGISVTFFDTTISGAPGSFNVNPATTNLTGFAEVTYTVGGNGDWTFSAVANIP